MEPRKLAPLTAAMLLANMTAENTRHHHWDDAPKPRAKSKNRDKVKAARKQRHQK